MKTNFEIDVDNHYPKQEHDAIPNHTNQHQHNNHLMDEYDDEVDDQFINNILEQMKLMKEVDLSNENDQESQESCEIQDNMDKIEE